MQIFEFYFNPKAKEEEVFQSFLFEPTNILERKLGSLYIVGHLSKALPQNFKFLENLALKIKKKYYSLSAHSSEKALRETLRSTNEFLADQVQKGNVNWLGNLNLVVCSLKDGLLNFTLTGKMKIFLLRFQRIIDIGKDLELEEMEPWPLKIFANIVSGKLSEKDKILILTKDIFEFFREQNLIEEVAKIEPVEEKKLKNLIKSKEKLFQETSGIFFLIDLTEKIAGKEKLSFEKKIPALSLEQIFSPTLKFFSKFKVKKFWPEKLIFFRLPKLTRIKLKAPANLKKNLCLILFLILVLVIGGFFAQRERASQIKAAKIVLEKTQTKIDWAERALELKERDKANQFLKEAWQEILTQTKPGSPLEKEAQKLKNEIEEKLYKLNNLVKIGEPELIFDFKNLKFIPEKEVFFQEKLYFFSPALPNLYQLNIKEKKGDFILTDQKFSLATQIENKFLLFYLRPDLIFPLKENKIVEPQKIKIPYSDFYFNSFSAFKSNFYSLDGKSGEIVKFFFSENEKEISGKLWLSPSQILSENLKEQTKKPLGAKSMAVDGFLWVLNKDNLIDKYYAGNFQETLNLDFFPYPKDLTKIFTSENLPYLYLLEPVQKRIIILDKNGKIIKQFQSEKFDNLKDFSVSEDGKTIYLLNGLKIYQINL